MNDTTNVYPQKKLSIETVAAVVVTIIAVASAIGTFYVTPYRVTAAEAAIVVIQADQRNTRDVLIRIDENVKQLKETAAAAAAAR